MGVVIKGSIREFTVDTRGSGIGLVSGRRRGSVSHPCTMRLCLKLSETVMEKKLVNCFTIF